MTEDGLEVLEIDALGRAFRVVACIIGNLEIWEFQAAAWDRVVAAGVDTGELFGDEETELAANMKALAERLEPFRVQDGDSIPYFRLTLEAFRDTQIQPKGLAAVQGAVDCLSKQFGHAVEVKFVRFTTGFDAVAVGIRFNAPEPMAA